MGLVSELRRRNVFRMAALYAAAAWLVMQVVDVVEGKLPLPDWMGSAVLAVLAVGFRLPGLSLVLRADARGHHSATPTLHPGRVDHAGFTGPTRGLPRHLAVRCAAVLLFAYDKWWTGPPPETPSPFCRSRT